MAIASILCLVDGGAGSEASLACALEVGRAMDAYVEVLHVELDPESAVPLAADGMTATMIEEIVDSVEQESKKRSEAAHDVYRRLCLEAGLKAVEPGTVPGAFAVAWRSQRGREHDVVARRGALFDLIVLARRGGEEEPAITPTLETALMESGRPVLVTPLRAPESLGNHVAVAWRDSVPGIHALAYAMPFLQRAEAVTVITVGDGEIRADPRDIVAYLAHHKVEAQARSVAAGGREAGAALLQAAGEAGADLLVMGAYAHSRLRQLILGGVTSTVLRQAELPLLLAH